ncbi:MauE/DoxX family redox-associated membrane protein [Halostreptopolyspora alba]|uniref:MauE/DoxX family redox-associated membrane protein n=1 Tax=Halostreptopolyspora alba TaxID=2487137 RepID=UPI0026CB4CC7
MLDAIRDTQLLVVSLVLVLGALGKFTSPFSRGAASLLPVSARRWFTRAHGAAEVVAAGVLLTLTGPGGDTARVATATLFAGGVGVLLVLRRRDPEMGCGCFGGLSTTPIGWRVITRAALFAVAAASTVGLDTSGFGVLGALTPWHGMTIVAEVVLLVALSPESRELAVRLGRRDPCETRVVSVRGTRTRLMLSGVWRANAAFLVNRRPLDVWRRGCWRFLHYSGRRRGRPVDVVFGVPLHGRGSAVRVAITDAETGVSLPALGATPPGEPEPRPWGGAGAGGAGGGSG